LKRSMIKGKVLEMGMMNGEVLETGNEQQGDV
jgi:hypothetical protein